MFIKLNRIRWVDLVWKKSRVISTKPALTFINFIWKRKWLFVCCTEAFGLVIFYWVHVFNWLIKRKWCRSILLNALSVGQSESWMQCHAMVWFISKLLNRIIDIEVEFKICEWIVLWTFPGCVFFEPREMAKDGIHRETFNRVRANNANAKRATKWKMCTWNIKMCVVTCRIAPFSSQIYWRKMCNSGIS